MISIIICTYNRPNIVIKLISLLRKQTVVPNEIIVVDSSDTLNKCLVEDNYIKYIQSSHKNQPYQRYLGFLNSSNDWLLYLDDDMEPSNINSIESIIQLKKEKYKYDAFAIGFQDLHSETSLSLLPSTKLTIANGSINRILRLISAYPILKEGKAGWNGVKGSLPKGNNTEWFSGGAFFVKKGIIFKNFNFCLFSIFEKKLGTGEDFIISYNLSRYGKIWSTKNIFFYHNDQKNSNYSTNVYKYNLRLIYSRLYLNLEKARLSNKNKFLAVIYFIYFSFWRFLGLSINFIINPNVKRLNAILGFKVGFFKSYELLFNNFKKEKFYWYNEAKKDNSII